MLLVLLAMMGRALDESLAQFRWSPLGPFAVAAVTLAVQPALAEAGHLTVDGSEFVLRLEDGRLLRGEGLAGATFVLRTPERDLTIAVDGTERAIAPGGPILLYRLSVLDPQSRAPRPLCNPDATGRRAGIPMQNPAGEGLSLTCTSGAEGKCILMGYRPWEERDGRVPMRDLFRACVHLIRADYGGDNRPSTRDGTTIDIYDRFGVQTPADTSMEFEAAWGVDGAVCVARPRIAENVSLDDIAHRYPRLQAGLGPERCNDETALSFPGALLFNRSSAGPPRTH